MSLRSIVAVFKLFFGLLSRVVKRSEQKKSQPGILARFGLAASRYSRSLVILILALAVVGGIVYARLIDRDGFPQLDIPINIVSANYFVDDADRVDAELSRPLAESLSGLDEVNSVEATSRANGLVGVVTFVEGFEASQGPDLIRRQLEASDWPAGIEPEVSALQVATYLGQYDAVLAIYQSEAEPALTGLQAVAEGVALQVAAWDEIESAAVVPLQVADALRQDQLRQISFNQMGLAEGGEVNFYKNIFVGVVYDRQQTDTLGLSALLNDNLDQLELVGADGQQYQATVAGDFAVPINRQISSLQNNLLTGLAAIALVSLFLISWRSAPITALFMASVVLLTIGVLYVFGLALNTIVLFSLVLVLGLFVDDATIVVEAIEARRQRGGSWRQVIGDSLGRVASASWAGTMTTALVFVPLLFVSGLIGDIIIYIPMTIIVALLVSFVLSITMIPALSRHLILPAGRKVGRLDKANPFIGLTQALGRASGWLPAQLAGPRRRRAIWILAAVLVAGLGFIALTARQGERLGFNIFPSARDGDNLSYSFEFPASYDLETAESRTDSLQQVVVETIGPENIDSIYYGLLQSPADQRQAEAFVTLTPYQSRSVTSSEIVEQLESGFEDHLAGTGISFRVGGDGGGPPAEEFPFGVLAINEDPAQAASLAKRIEQHLAGRQLAAGNGSEINVIDSRITPEVGIERRDGRRVMVASFKFDGDDNISAAVSLARDEIEKEFSAEIESGVVDFDLGQEQEFTESFTALGYAFPLAIVIIYVLLAIQFGSLVKPFLMLLAIPLSLPGVVIFLAVTDTPISFFVMLGLIGLAGIAVNNTILLTEYANQQRRRGLGPAQAIAVAVSERFRPLVATTLTTLVALIPLVLNDPFWEVLAGVIVSGLVSSTLLVILLFPSFYLGSGWLWRRWRRLWHRMRSKSKTSN